MELSELEQCELDPSKQYSIVLWLRLHQNDESSLRILDPTCGSSSGNRFISFNIEYKVHNWAFGALAIAAVATGAEVVGARVIGAYVIGAKVVGAEPSEPVATHYMYKAPDPPIWCGSLRFYETCKTRAVRAGAVGAGAVQTGDITWYCTSSVYATLMRLFEAPFSSIQLQPGSNRITIHKQKSIWRNKNPQKCSFQWKLYINIYMFF
jgi:hypothetical protein